MRFVSRHAPIPIMADESLFSAQDAPEIIQRDAAPYFNLKLSNPDAPGIGARPDPAWQDKLEEVQ
jgi:hypothetical protein